MTQPAIKASATKEDETLSDIPLEKQQLITFMVAQQEYAIDIMTIREIKGWTETTSLPNSPAYMRGVINLRGIVVPIIDLKARFGMPLTQPTKTHVVMIVTVSNRIIGLLVDAVCDIITYDISKICPVPQLSSEPQQTILSGLVHMEKRLLGMLILEKIVDQNLIIENHMSQVPKSTLQGE